MYMALRDSIKYCYSVNEPGELYDLRQDPGEERNRIDDPELAPAREKLLREIQRRVDIEEMERRIAEYNTQRDTVASALNQSNTHVASTRRRIAQFRKACDEPWWDGGVYMAQSEPAAINPMADDD
jgi:arylsulfatase A-like enzyme